MISFKPPHPYRIYTLIRRLAGPQSRSGRLEDGKNSCFCREWKAGPSSPWPRVCYPGSLTWPDLGKVLSRNQGRLALQSIVLCGHFSRQTQRKREIRTSGHPFRQRICEMATPIYLTFCKPELQSSRQHTDISAVSHHVLLKTKARNYPALDYICAYFNGSRRL